MAKTKRKWFPLRIIQSNLKYTLGLILFMADLQNLLFFNPDLMCLNEVARRRSVLTQVAKNAKMRLYQAQGPGEQGGIALLAKASRFAVLKTVSEALTKEPPGKPTKRYASCMILWDRISHCYVIFIGTHTVAAVERGGRLNPIPRTAFYISHIFNLIAFAVRMRRMCKKEFGGYGQVIVAGDLNWHWGGVETWINRALGSYFRVNHIVLGVLPTLGRRAVDVVMIRASVIRFIKHFTIKQNSDHKGLIVDAEIGQVATPAYMKQHPHLMTGGL